MQRACQFFLPPGHAKLLKVKTHKGQARLKPFPQLFSRHDLDVTVKPSPRTAEPNEFLPLRSMVGMSVLCWKQAGWLPLQSGPIVGPADALL